MPATEITGADLKVGDWIATSGAHSSTIRIRKVTHTTPQFYFLDGRHDRAAARKRDRFHERLATQEEIDAHLNAIAESKRRREEAETQQRKREAREEYQLASRIVSMAQEVDGLERLPVERLRQIVAWMEESQEE